MHCGNTSVPVGAMHDALMGPMQRAAAVLVHAAMSEENATGDAPQQFEARVSGVSGAQSLLMITTTHLCWHALRCGAEMQQVPLGQIIADDIDDGDLDRAELVLGLSSSSDVVYGLALSQN